MCKYLVLIGLFTLLFSSCTSRMPLLALRYYKNIDTINVQCDSAGVSIRCNSLRIEKEYFFLGYNRFPHFGYCKKTITYYPNNQQKTKAIVKHIPVAMMDGYARNSTFLRAFDQEGNKTYKKIRIFQARGLTGKVKRNVEIYYKDGKKAEKP